MSIDEDYWPYDRPVHRAHSGVVESLRLLIFRKGAEDVPNASAVGPVRWTTPAAWARPGFRSGARGWTAVVVSPGRYELGCTVAPATTCLACTPNSTSPAYPVSSHVGTDQRRLGYGHIH